MSNDGEKVAAAAMAAGSCKSPVGGLVCITKDMKQVASGCRKLVATLPGWELQVKAYTSALGNLRKKVAALTGGNLAQSYKSSLTCSIARPA